MAQGWVWVLALLLGVAGGGLLAGGWRSPVETHLPAAPTQELKESPAVGARAAGCSGADIFWAPGGAGASVLVAPAALLGLAPGDNITALALDQCTTAVGTDGDGDGIDDACDHCLIGPNPAHYDANADGYGSACDADCSGDGVIGGPDFVVFVTQFIAGAPGPSGLICADVPGCTQSP